MGNMMQGSTGSSAKSLHYYEGIKYPQYKCAELNRYALIR